MYCFWRSFGEEANILLINLYLADCNPPWSTVPCLTGAYINCFKTKSQFSPNFSFPRTWINEFKKVNPKNLTKLLLYSFVYSFILSLSDSNSFLIILSYYYGTILSIPIADSHKVPITDRYPRNFKLLLYKSDKL